MISVEKMDELRRMIKMNLADTFYIEAGHVDSLDRVFELAKWAMETAIPRFEKLAADGECDLGYDHGYWAASALAKLPAGIGRGSL